MLPQQMLANTDMILGAGGCTRQAPLPCNRERRGQSKFPALQNSNPFCFKDGLCTNPLHFGT